MEMEQSGTEIGNDFGPNEADGHTTAVNSALSATVGSTSAQPSCSRPSSADSGLHLDDDVSAVLPEVPDEPLPTVTPRSSTSRRALVFEEAVALAVPDIQPEKKKAAPNTTEVSTNVPLVQQALQVALPAQEADVDRIDRLQPVIIDVDPAAGDEANMNVDDDGADTGLQPIIIDVETAGDQANVNVDEDESDDGSDTDEDEDDLPPARAQPERRGRGRRGGRERGRRARGRPRSQRRVRKREWDVSDGSISSVDDEEGFPSRISPRNKKPYQGYTKF
jgi:hypothetical protein